MAKYRRRRYGSATTQDAKAGHRSLTIKLLTNGAVHIGHLTLNEEFERLYRKGATGGVTKVVEAAREKNTEPRKRGRSPIYDWPQFVGEVHRLLNLRGLPRKQSASPKWRSKADLANCMSAWCSDNWPEEPSQSMIRLWVNRALLEFNSEPTAEK